MTRIILLLSFFVLALSALATTLISPAQSGMEFLKNGLEDYADSHSGQLPPNFEALNPRLIQAIEESFGGEISKTVFATGTNGVPLNATDQYNSQLKGTILAVTMSPVREDRRYGDGRYVVWKEDGGRLRMSWLDEPTIKEQFQKAGIMLPSGPLDIQPPTGEKPPPPGVIEYAEKHFKDPTRPTAEEIEQLKKDFPGILDEKSVTSTPSMPTAQAKPALSPGSSPASSTEAVKRQPRFPILPVATVVAGIVLVAAFLLTRKRS